MLVFVVIVVIVGAVILRQFAARRPTLEESVDRYRRTLDAVHDASSGTRVQDPNTPRPSLPLRESRPRDLPGMRGQPLRLAVVAGMAVATIIGVVIVVKSISGDSKPGAKPTPAASRAATTTTTARPTTTTVATPIVAATGTSGSDFVVSRSSFTVTIAATQGACWIDAKDASGAVIYAGTIASGQSQSVVGAVATLQLGNPRAVTLTIDGTEVPYAPTAGTSNVLHFQVSAG